MRKRTVDWTTVILLYQESGGGEKQVEEKETPHLPDRKIEGLKWCLQEDGPEKGTGQKTRKLLAFFYYKT